MIAALVRGAHDSSPHRTEPSAASRVGVAVLDACGAPWLASSVATRVPSFRTLSQPWSAWRDPSRDHHEGSCLIGRSCRSDGSSSQEAERFDADCAVSASTGIADSAVERVVRSRCTPRRNHNPRVGGSATNLSHCEGVTFSLLRKGKTGHGCQFTPRFTVCRTSSMAINCLSLIEERSRKSHSIESRKFICWRHLSVSRQTRALRATFTKSPR